MKRRDLMKAFGCTLTAAMGTGAAELPRMLGGVKVSIQSFCFNDRPIDAMLDAVEQAGFGAVELWVGHVEPSELRSDRKKLRDWRLHVDLDHFRGVRRKFDQRGILLQAYNISPRNDFTDEEIGRAFQMTRELGTDLMTSSSNVATAARLSHFADEYRIRVALHNHSHIKEDEFATAADYERALRGRSRRLGINLDIGHFGAAGQDPTGFIRQNHDRIFILHVKDRKKDQGPQVLLGEGDCHVAEVLLMVRKNRWPMIASLEHVFQEGDRIAAMRKNFAWMQRTLGGPLRKPTPPGHNSTGKPSSTGTRDKLMVETTDAHSR